MDPADTNKLYQAALKEVGMQLFDDFVNMDFLYSLLKTPIKALSDTFVKNCQIQWYIFKSTLLSLWLALVYLFINHYLFWTKDALRNRREWDLTGFDKETTQANIKGAIISAVFYLGSSYKMQQELKSNSEAMILVSMNTLSWFYLIAVF